MRRPGNTGIVLLFVLLLGRGYGAFAAQWDVTTLMGELAARESGQASFSEKKYLDVLEKPIELKGTLAFAPGHLEKLTLQPYRERMSVDGNSVVIESGAHRSRRQLALSRYPALQGFIEGIRATLTGDLATLQRFYRLELHGSAEDWDLVLVPDQVEMAAVVSRISIRGAGKHIATIEVVQKNGDHSVMTITEKKQ
jgi:hypothetical protein